MIYVFLKWMLVAALFASGIFFLAHGFGADIPLIEYKGWKAHNLPTGFGIIAAGIALAKFWKIEITKTAEGTNQWGPYKIWTNIKGLRGPKS